MKLCSVLNCQIRSKLNFYSQFNPTSFTINQFTSFGKTARNEDSYLFLRKELPVRLANIMKEFSMLPNTLRALPSVGEVIDMYRQSFNDLLQFEGVSQLDYSVLDKFTDTLIMIRNRHQDVVMKTGQGVMELKETHSVDQNMDANIQYFLDRFYMNRISIRMLINQHTLLFGDSPNYHNHIGCIDPHCDVVKVIEDAYHNARFLCDQYYLASPELTIRHFNGIENKMEVIKSNGKAATKFPLTVTYVPSHLYHILFELFKNSMRAVVEYHDSSSDVPPIDMVVAMGHEDLTIKLSDQGGGIPRSLMEYLFNYMYSTAPQPTSSGQDTPPLAGYGYGLPLSRLYARYFHGDLVLTSQEGFGTDAFVYLKAMSNEASEMLPIYNKSCQKQYQTPHNSNHDWSYNNSRPDRVTGSTSDENVNVYGSK